MRRITAVRRHRGTVTFTQVTMPRCDVRTVPLTDVMPPAPRASSLAN